MLDLRWIREGDLKEGRGPVVRCAYDHERCLFVKADTHGVSGAVPQPPTVLKNDPMLT
jgi:hypothetical protein